MNIEYGRPMLDWLTITSYKNDIATWATQLIAEQPVQESEKIIVYDGVRGSSDTGSIFCGWGEQGLLHHCMMTLSGAMSDAYGVRALGMVELEKGVSGCSRVDLQITIDSKVDINQLATHLAENGYSSQVTIYRTLSGGRVGDTLYIGSPKSDKRIRIYHKSTGTRFEVQYRRDYATSCASSLQDSTRGVAHVVMANHLLYEVQKIAGFVVVGKCGGLDRFVKMLQSWATGQVRPTSNARTQGDTERWIRMTVMGALVKECAKNEELRRWVLAQLGVSEI